MIVEELKGGSLSRTVVILDGDIKKVRKYISSKKNREYGLVRWHSQIRKLQVMGSSIGLDKVPKMIGLGVEGDEYYYDMEYFEHSNSLLDFLKLPESKNKEGVAFEKLISVVERYSAVEYGSLPGAFLLYLQEEVVSVLDSIESCDSLTFDEQETLNYKIKDVVKLINANSNHLANISLVESLTHGNLTLENIMVTEDLSIKLIDLYGESYTESWLGDLSQLMQSIIGDYELINELDEIEFINIFETPSLDSYSSSYKIFGDLLMSYVNKLNANDRYVVNIFYASQFIRMFPFKLELTPRKAFYFLNKGIDIIFEVLK